MPFRCHAQETAGRQSVLLDSIVVKGHRHSSAVRQTRPGGYSWNMQKLDFLPKILGNADPIHYAQMLPGIQTNSEYRSGVNIEGCDNSQNMVSLAGVPVYNAGHMLGFFSVFNGPHFASMDVTLSASSAAYPNRVGGTLEMCPYTAVADTLGGEFSVGLISSQATLRAPLGGRTSLTASLRASYLNLLYGSWLKADGSEIRYSFGDANLSLVHRLTDRDRLFVDFYCGTDRGRFSEASYLAGMKASWGNVMGAFHWLHDTPRWHLRNTLYATSYRNRFSMDFQEMEGRLPSGITDVGWRLSATRGRLGTGCDVAAHFVSPQSIKAEGYHNDITSAAMRQHALECSAYADWRQPLAEALSLCAGVRATMWRTGSYCSFSADPSLSLRYDDGHGLQLTASCFTRSQYLFQTGFSDAGLPTEFWMACDERNRPLRCLGTAVGAVRMFGRGMWRLSADVFYRRISNQTEYNGTVYDFLNSTYDVNQYLLHGKGRNAGCTVMLQKCAGPLTGWLSYTFTHARRTFPKDGLADTYPANHERPHELNIVAAYSPLRRWTFGATFVWASGTPFTAPTSIGILNGNIIATYGRHNASRLGSYLRLDLSANYKWASRRGMERGVNLSVYNATSHSNELFYRVSANRKGQFAYKPVTFLVDVLPSLSYYCKF